MNQKGLVSPTLIAGLFLIALIAAFYLGTKTNQTSLVSSPTPLPSSKATVSQSPAAKVSEEPLSDLAISFINRFPKDMPVYPGAKMADYSDGGAGNMGKCMEELLKEDSKCLQVNFKFKKGLNDASVEKIVNWYVANPSPDWTYRGVYGDQRDYQFGDIYSKSVYYRMEFIYPNPEHSEVEIYYNGPYPISNLSPKP